MGSDAPESPPSLGRLRRVGEMPSPANPQPSARTSAKTWPAAIIASRMMGTPT